MLSQQTTDIPFVLTHLILERYAKYVIQRNRKQNGVTERAPDLNSSDEGDDVPGSLEEALAPLEILYGKTFVSAVGIAIHGAETVIRYVEVPEHTVTDDEALGEEEEEQQTHADAHTLSSPTPLSSCASRSRCVYKVGDHILFSPYYCPCSAYAYQSVRRQDVWCCKHMLALQLAIKLEESGIPQDNLRSRPVPQTLFESIIHQALLA